MLSEMKRRNDETEAIEAREWDRLVYGDDYWINRLATKASVDGITRDDLVAFHKLLANPANFVVAVAGDFDRADDDRQARTRRSAPGSRQGRRCRRCRSRAPRRQPGVYLVNKPDVNQGRVSIGHLGVQRPLADEFALAVANDILGGGGFTAWMMSRVRSDEGLAYSAYSSYVDRRPLPGRVPRLLPVASRRPAPGRPSSPSTSMNKIAHARVTEKELDTSKNSFIETFPRIFETKVKTVTRFAQDELVGRPHEYWTSYRRRMARSTAADVKAAAAAHITPDQLIILVVGNVDEILKGHPDHPDLKFDMFGKLNRVPLRDPMTLQPLP